MIAAVAPIAWGSNYYVTHQFLPAGQPLWASAFRALPAGLLLLVMCRRLPHGQWWWRSLVLGTLNVGAFFVLIFLTAHLLPTSLAATVMATSPMVMMLLAWALVAERPRAAPLVGAALGIAGVAVMVFSGTVAANGWGVAASLGAMVMSSVGFVLAKRWSGQVDVLSSTCWQLVAGSLLLVPIAAAVEGAPPIPTGAALAGYAYVAVVATALAFVCWFAALRRLPTGTVGLVGLLNPVTGMLLGTMLAGEDLTGRQLVGMAMVIIGVLLGQPERVGRLLDLTRVAWADLARLGRPGTKGTPAPVRAPGPLLPSDPGGVEEMDAAGVRGPVYCAEVGVHAPSRC